MASEHEKTRQRQLRRREEDKKRRQQQKLRRRRILMGLAAAAVVLGLCALVIMLVRHAATPGPEAVTGETVPAPTRPVTGQTVIHLAFGGDLVVTDKTVAAGVTPDGYDYKDVFLDVAPLLAGADASVLNFEGNLCGTPYGSADGKAPPELAAALSAMGVDMVQMANSYALKNGLLGMEQTLEGLRRQGLEPVGAFASQEEVQRQKGFTLRSIHGVKVAFVAFTKGMDDLGLPVGAEGQVNLLYTDYTSTYQKVDKEGIGKILDAVELEEPDITVALVHWGSEYNQQVSQSQKDIASLMQKKGVDAIIGTHSHHLQDVVYHEETGTVVAWSLGDFFGDGERAGTDSSIILDLEITRDNATGETRISGVGYDPICTVTTMTEPEEEGAEPEISSVRILRIREAIEGYEANSVDKVDTATYEAMKAALSRIGKKIKTE
ncbi:MAG: CapA family protein [Oscillospiraceae bacterium]|nr:CapA family protein [Oscillospiraceae bacterium]